MRAASALARPDGGAPHLRGLTLPDHPSTVPPAAVPGRKPSSPEPARLGQELLHVHGRLRARVGALESALATDTADTAAFATSCLSFCRALRRHHLGEDEGAFAVLRRRDPDLGAVLDALVRDHEFLDPLLDRLEVLVADAGGGRDAAEVERELGGIAAVLENHLAYEERVLVAVLDGLEVEPGSADEEHLRAPLDGVVEPAGP